MGKKITVEKIRIIYEKLLEDFSQKDIAEMLGLFPSEVNVVARDLVKAKVLRKTDKFWELCGRVDFLGLAPGVSDRAKRAYDLLYSGLRDDEIMDCLGIGYTTWDLVVMELVLSGSLRKVYSHKQVHFEKNFVNIDSFLEKL